jgi:O-antigen/teichoic acid export membrane protein
MTGESTDHRGRERWDPGRDETETERLDRNWSSLLQELRVAQTGVQVLTGFLLILPFQDRFAELGDGARLVYLLTVACSMGSTVLLVAPVSMHRVLFRRRRIDALVASSHKFAMAGLLLLAMALTGVAAIIFDAVLGAAAAWVAGVVTLLALASSWFWLPVRQRRVKRPNRERL